MEWTRGPTIGRGSTATVSLATSAISSELFALKSTELSNSVFLQKEQFFLSKICCPYVVKYIGCNTTVENGRSMYNICMEFAPDGTLHDVISRHGGRLDESLIRSYTRSLLNGLDYLHRNIGLVHCDIKSKNVLIGKDGVKIADFGCTKFASGDTSAFSGTPAFMSPEVARGEEQGFPADIWALGCTVVEMATGNLPWAEEIDDPLSIIYRIGFSSDVPQVPRWLSEKCQDFLGKCLRRDPKERWTAKKLLDHPFLGEFDSDLKDINDDDHTMSSPSCVLDHHFWNSMDTFDGPRDLKPEGVSEFSSWHTNLSPAERIKTLIGSNSQLVAEAPTWNFEEDWITVRSNELGEKDAILVDNALVPAESLALDSILYEQEQQHLESSIFVEDSLLEFFLENGNISNNDSNVRIDEEYGYFVSENVNFVADNDDECGFFPSLLCSISSGKRLTLRNSSLKVLLSRLDRQV